MALFGVEIRGDGAGQRTKNSRSELEVPLARKATTIARHSEPWIKTESMLSALLCGIISAGISYVIGRHTRDVGETHVSSFTHAAAMFERYAAVGWISIATSYSAIALRYSPLGSARFPAK